MLLASQPIHKIFAAHTQTQSRVHSLIGCGSFQGHNAGTEPLKRAAPHIPWGNIARAFHILVNILYTRNDGHYCASLAS
jgi:hypothetical protein